MTIVKRFVRKFALVLTAAASALLVSQTAFAGDEEDPDEPACPWVWNICHVTYGDGCYGSNCTKPYSLMCCPSQIPSVCPGEEV